LLSIGVSIRDSYEIEILSQDITPYVVVAYVIAMDHAEWNRLRNWTQRSNAGRYDG
jgi:hypothetical protein